MSTKFLINSLFVLIAGVSCFAGFPKAHPQSAGGNGGGPIAASAVVLQNILQTGGGLPTSILDEAYCVVVFPSVKKEAVGIGGSHGHGVLICRKGAEMRGSWGNPAAYELDQGSLGVQLGSTATDFVLVVVSHNGVQQMLNGKAKLGATAAVAPGPTGAQAAGYNADARGTDVLTYSRAQGLFAGVSLDGASLRFDEKANKAIYGEEIGAREIISGRGLTPGEAKPLIDLLDKISPARR